MARLTQHEPSPIDGERVTPSLGYKVRGEWFALTEYKRKRERMSHYETFTTTPVGNSGRSITTKWEIWETIDKDCPNPLRRYGVAWRMAGDLGEYRQRFTPCESDLALLVSQIQKDPYLGK